MYRDPFAVLGVPPTLDVARVKRAYFEAVAHHPPHRDPEAFQRVRKAYEELLRPFGISAAFIRAPLDVDASVAPYRERFDTLLAQAESAAKIERHEQASHRRLMTLVAGLAYDRALERFGGPSAGDHGG